MKTLAPQINGSKNHSRCESQFIIFYRRVLS